jgi:hypothetical protein
MFFTATPKSRKKSIRAYTVKEEGIYAIVVRVLSALKLCLNFYGWRISHRCSIGEDEGGDHLVAVVDLLNQGGGIWYLFDIDLFEGDSQIVELALEALAIATPGCGVHNEAHGKEPSRMINDCWFAK